MNSTGETKKTLFQEEVEKHQQEQKRTKTAGLREGLLIAGASAAGLLISALVRIIFGGIPDLMVVVILALVIGLVIGLYRIVVSLVRSEKSVTCPKCGTVHMIFKKERLYLCTACWSLLYMGEDSQAPFQLLGCDYCGHEAAVTPDHGAFACPNCGVTRRATAAPVEWQTTPCPDCEEAVPQEALYCIHCDRILHPLPADDKDWEAGKDAHGHYHFARMLLATFPAKEAALEARLRADHPRSGKQQWPETFATMPPMHVLGRAQRSLEEALKEPELRPLVLGMLPEVDYLYARLLVLELKMILWAEGPDRVPLAVKADYEKGTSLDIFDDGPHIRARKRIEAILRKGSLRSIGSIGPWKDQSLINTKLHFSKNYMGETSSTSVLTSYAGLVAEALRFAEWAEQSRRSTDLVSAVLELKELISARRKEGLPTPAGPTVAVKTEPVTKAEVAPGAARPVSSASITPDMARSTAKPAMSGRKWGCGLVACGSIVLAVGLVMVAAIVMAEFDPARAVDNPMVIIGRMAICVLPILLVGGGLLVFGIARLRAQRQPPSATEFGGYRTKAEKEAWAQAMVGAEFITEGKHHDALTISEQALSKSPRCKEAWVVKGGALALLNRPEEALACYEQALAIDPSYEEALTQKAALLQVG